MIGYRASALPGKRILTNKNCGIMKSQNKKGGSEDGSKKRMLLTFGWSVVIMAIMLMLDSDEATGHFPYVDGDFDVLLSDSGFIAIADCFDRRFIQAKNYPHTYAFRLKYSSYWSYTGSTVCIQGHLPGVTAQAM